MLSLSSLPARHHIRNKNLRSALSALPKRRLLSEQTTAGGAKHSSQPPYLIRIGLVGTTVAAATPAFPALGLVRAVNHFIKNPTTRFGIFGGTTAILSFAGRDFLPVLYDHAELLAPIARVNGCVAAIVYAAADGLAGGPKLLLEIAATPLNTVGRSVAGGTTSTAAAAATAAAATAGAAGGSGMAALLRSLGSASVLGAGIGAVVGLIAPYGYSYGLEYHFGVSLDLKRWVSFSIEGAQKVVSGRTGSLHALLLQS